MTAKRDLFDPHYWNEWEGENFTLIFPEDWDLMEPFLPAMKFMAIASDNYDYGASVGVSVANQTDGLSVEEQMEQYKKNMPMFVADIDNVNIQKNTDEHLDFYKATYTGTIDDVLVQFEQYLWFVCNKLITLSFTHTMNPPEEFQNIKEIIFLAFKIK